MFAANTGGMGGSMGRAILGVILGYVAMVVVLFAVFTALYLFVLKGGSFKPGSYEVSDTWAYASIGVSLAAAAVGGLVCRKVGRTRGAVLSLIVLMVLMGGLSIMMELKKPDPGPRTGEVANLEAMQKARVPMWLTLLQPVIGIVGVAAGGGLCCCACGGCRPAPASP